MSSFSAQSSKTPGTHAWPVTISFSVDGKVPATSKISTCLIVIHNQEFKYLEIAANPMPPQSLAIFKNKNAEMFEFLDEHT